MLDDARWCLLLVLSFEHAMLLGIKAHDASPGRAQAVGSMKLEVVDSNKHRGLPYTTQRHSVLLLTTSRQSRKKERQTPTSHSITVEICDENPITLPDQAKVSIITSNVPHSVH